MFNIKIGTISSKIHTPYEGMYQGGGTQEDKVVTGNGYVDLTKAVANKLIYLKLFGGTEQRNLPAGYTELDGIIGDGTAYIDLNCPLDQDDEVDLYFTKPSALISSNVFGYRNSATANNISVIIASSGNAVLDFNNSDYTPYRLNTAINLNTQYEAVLNKTGRYVYQGTTLVDSNTTACNDTIETPTCFLFDLGGAGLASKYAGIINKCIIVGKRNMIPCKNSENEVGMYDTINGVFYGNANTSGEFTAGNVVVPTPEHPVDIVSNNGVIKVRHQSGLPLGYTLLDYITADNGPYIDTGIKIASTDTVETEFANSSATGYGALYGVYKTGESSAFYANSTYYGYDVDNNKINTNVSVDTSWHKVIHNFVDGTLTIDQTTVNFTPFTFANTDNNGLFTRMYNGAYGYFFKGSCKSHKIYRNGNLILNLIPAKDSSNNIGMYDLVNGHFFTNDGTGAFTYGQEVSDGLEIYTEGTIETVEDELSNTATAEMLLKIGDYADEQEMLSGDITRKIGIKVLDGTETGWTKLSAANYVSLPKTAISDIVSGTDAPCLSNYFGQVLHSSISTVEECFSVGASYINFKKAGDPTTAQFKQWLTDQYNAGTPVIVIYQLATSSTESVSGQTLNVKSGTNRIEITQASINNLGIEAKYTARQ